MLAAGAFAQDFRASISGRVTDATGAVVPEAKVTITNTNTGVTQPAVTNAEGVFVVSYLIPGPYEVRVEAAGFKTALRDRITLQVSDRLTLDVPLEVGGAAETVKVTGDPPMIETNAAVGGTVVTGKELTQVMSLTRIPFMLAGLTPGVRIGDMNGTIPNPAGNGTASSLRVNGGINNESNEFLIDGSPNTAGNSVAFIPSSDAIQEFRVASDAYDAQFGRQMGSTVNVFVRSGTSQYHGDVYDFHRNSTLGANTFQSNLAGRPKAVWHFNMWGGQIGGPLEIPKVYNGRDKTFFFFNYEGMLDTEPRFSTRSVPTAEQRTGDYSKSVTVSGGQLVPLTIFDPLTTDATSGQRQAFPGNRIPANRLSPISQKVVSFVPLPNVTGGGAVATGVNNFLPHVPTVDTIDSAITRMDHQFSPKNRASASLRWNHWEESPVSAFGNVADNSSLSIRINRGIGLDDVHVFSPNTVWNTRYSLTRYESPSLSPGFGYNPVDLGFPASVVSILPVPAFPIFSIAGGLGATPISYQMYTTHSWTGVLTHIHGRHSLNSGIQYMVLQAAQFNAGAGAGSYSFSTGFTQRDYTRSDGVSGSSDASFLLGYPSSGTVATNASGLFSQHYLGFYFQDDWRVNPRLTINYGLRWDWEVPVTERYNRTNRGLDTTTASPVQTAAQAAYARSPIPELPVGSFAVRGGQLFAGAGGQPAAAYESYLRAWQPRAGVAYRVSDRTAVRAGFGIFTGKTTAFPTQNGFSITTPYISSVDNGQTPSASLSNPFPNGILASPGSTLGLSTSLGQAPSWIDATRGLPFSIQYSFHVQRELPGRFVADIGYVVNRSRNLAVSVPANNVPLAAYLALGQPRFTNGQLQAQPFRLNDLVTNPFFGLPGFEGTALGTSRTVAVSSLLSPFPQFAAFNRTNVSAGTATYRALEAKLEKRFSEHLSLLAAYTWSKELENLIYLNPIAYEVAHSLDPNDTPHHFSLAAVYNLPVGRGRPFLSRMNRVANGLIGGWQLSGNYNLQSGAPVSFSTNLTWNGKDPSIPRTSRTLNRWFDTSDFGIIAKADTYALRTTPLTFAHIRASRQNVLDAAIYKTFYPAEWMRTEFRLESFNALNHARFGAPNTDPTSSAFGTVVQSQLNQPRILQVALKVHF
jgi:hypothetical protein